MGVSQERVGKYCSLCAAQTRKFLHLLADRELTGDGSG